MQSVALKVGDLAKQTGVSVRTLHYYDEIGLLSPSHRTEAGYRLYDREDIIRLQQIVSLRQIGFSLEEIRECLEQHSFSFDHIIQLHTARLREQIELSQKLLNRLDAIAQAVGSMQTVSVEAVIQTIEAMNMLERYYTPEQLKSLRQRQESLGEERIQQVQADWQDLFDQVQVEMAKGTDLTAAPVKALARRSIELIQAFTGGDPGVEQALNRMWQQEQPEVVSRGMVDAAMMEYLARARSALEQSE
ncbi:MerR family transcriptional regulator [Leptolyngbya boryana NIES-2135]|jgi:DNA-binding transcriptional MerR regulator|uniref:MerR family transcriptional regulator n=1 Tax=Leptolyngbya boryana NIES-2135 TaxID=1973484 RepID=A0A1Z4JB77_LEPBY|nr:MULTISPECIES: MerR family transcriptional regulator [Leptolyngbya]BAY53963.1 MerR family transcriptional regulator [Leptolyngbya boryana NIES-2135]MBD2371576.1 MerR family transcriptional regulator [Leptolyngbya sp. FACHB-161]MBD2378113.1 MerR family transcriptional regulator [Leptolyngbya sp. FACHB-238]MBD2402518.1 MerR family transcriptional regulator [Leptolyngbya sp. FACHB-239]MBD2409012.1 MerR family transcriptional regulator [Leptolyngbya sp. FACHB-402]